MMCQACEQGDHDNCGMQTWCECDCEGYAPYLPENYHFRDDADGGRLARNTITHFVGPRMDICGRIIQRCTVCGAKLCDSQGVMMPMPKDGSPPIYATWPEGRVVRVTLGNPTHTEVLPDDEKLPTDACIIGMDV